MSYKTLLEKEGYPKEILDILDGAVKVPDFTIDAPANPSFGFPPALIPLWSNSGWPGYIGLVKDWFGNNQDTYVLYYSELNAFVEVGRNFEQLKAWLVFDFLCNVPDPEEVGEFADSIGFCGVSEVDSIFEHCEEVSDLGKLNVFNKDLPAAIEKGEEDGAPSWVTEAGSVDSIKGLIASGNFEQAWYTINSSGLDSACTYELLGKMSSGISDDSKRSMFNGLIDCWKISNLSHALSRAKRSNNSG